MQWCVRHQVCTCLHVEEAASWSPKTAAQRLLAYVSRYHKTQRNKNKLAARDDGPGLSAAPSDPCFDTIWRRRKMQKDWVFWECEYCIVRTTQHCCPEDEGKHEPCCAPVAHLLLSGPGNAAHCTRLHGLYAAGFYPALWGMLQFYLPCYLDCDQTDQAIMSCSIRSSSVSQLRFSLKQRWLPARQPLCVE